MEIKQRDFGKLKNGETAYLLSLTNNNNISIDLTNYGACLVSVMVPDRNGDPDDVVLGFDDAGAYETDDNCFGATIGRNANRIGGAEVDIEGIHYKLAATEGRNNLHGLPAGFHFRLWDHSTDNEKQSVKFSLISKDMDQGFPGKLCVSVVYTLTDNNEIIIEYSCLSDRATIVNMTNHSYFNLAGHDFGNIKDHILYIDSDHFTPYDDEFIPTGEIRHVSGTAFDFRLPKRIGHDLDSGDEQLITGQGYDHNFVLDDNSQANTKVRQCAVVHEENSGRSLEVFTDLPAVQFYIGNHINADTLGKNGAIYNRRAGFCLETQYYPDANHHPNFPDTILPADTPYKTTTIYKFGTV